MTDDGLQDYYDAVAGIELSDNAIDCLFQSDDEEDKFAGLTQNDLRE